MGEMKDLPVVFHWEETGDPKKPLKYVEVDCSQVPLEQTIPSDFANAYIQLTTDEMNQAARPNDPNVYQPPTGKFVYMDVGKWCGGVQTFGLVWGNTAVLCKYSPSSKPTAEPTGHLLNDILALPGVTEIKRVCIDGKIGVRWEKIRIILPDAHVAACPRWEWVKPDGKTPLDKLEEWERDEQKHKELLKRDIFESRLSIPHLMMFLIQLRLFARRLGATSPNRVTKENAPIQLTQVGDLYELWMKRALKFKAKKLGPPGVDLAEPADESLASVGDWICETHEFHSELFEEFDLCQNDPNIVCTFLHGNHDSYLSIPAVVDKANAKIAFRCSQPQGTMLKKQMKLSKVYYREPSGRVFDEGLFIEHGQRCDQYNSDGNPDGHGKTQMADIAALKALDTTRRNSFAAAAAGLWLKRGCDFSCYVQGHTHEPYLARLIVTHSIGKHVIYPGLVGPGGLFSPPTIIWKEKRKLP